MRRRIVLLALLLLAMAVAGCWYGRLPDIYGGAFRGSGGQAATAAPAEPTAPQAPGAEPASPTASADQPTEQPAPAPQPEPQPAQPTTVTDSNVTITRTVTRAPTYPSSPFVATYPTSRDGTHHVCKSFTQSTDNKNDCMVHCRAQLMSVGSCSCMELEKCPAGIDVVD